MFIRKINKQLIKWKNSANKKPLIIRGARQIGKTTTIQQFGQEHYKNFISINLDNSKFLSVLSDEVSLEDFISILKSKFQYKFIPNETLLFIDEIQEAPYIISLLRYFYEERPDIHIIAAGSLLEARLKEKKITIPVGRIEYLYMHPLTFFEFLQASNNDELVKILSDIKIGDSISPAIHDLLMDKFSEYSIIGGMPEPIAQYLQDQSIQKTQELYIKLEDTYIQDLYKYTKKGEFEYLSFILEQLPYFGGHIVKYTNFANSNYRSEYISSGFKKLRDVMLLNLIKATTNTDIPLFPKNKMGNKLITLDHGFISARQELNLQMLKSQSLNSIFKGSFAEQIVGESLVRTNTLTKKALYYWTKDIDKKAAEVDFCFTQQGKVYGIEVKAGSPGKLKSLFSFADNIENTRLIRVYSGEFNEEKKVHNNKEYTLLNLPFYLIDRIKDF